MAIYAIENPIFQPSMRIITAITSASEAEVTTSFDHDYITGTIVRIIIPQLTPTSAYPIGFGMSQINGMTGTITVTSDTTFIIPINTTTFDSFSVPTGVSQQAQVVPIGEDNDMLTAAVQNVLPFNS